MRRVAVVALCFSLLLAGCSMFGGPAGPTTAATTDDPSGADAGEESGDATDAAGADAEPTDGPASNGDDSGTDASEGTVPAGFDVPGITAGGVNETRLLRTHFLALNRSTGRMELAETSAEGTVTRSVLVLNRSTSLARDPGSDGSTTWSRGNVTAQRRMGLDGPVYSYRFDSTGSGLGTSGGTAAIFGFTVYLTSGDYEVAGTVQRNGTRLLRLRATEAGSSGFGSAYGVYQGTALVDADGVVRSLEGEFAIDESETPTQFEVTTSPAPERVPTPDWLATMPHVRGELVADGRAIALRVVGGAPVPAGTTLEVDAGDVRAEVRTEGAIRPGETRYLAVDADGSSVTLRQSRPAGDGFADLRAQYNQVSFDVPGPEDASEPVSVRVSVGASVFAAVGEE